MCLLIIPPWVLRHTQDLSDLHLKDRLAAIKNRVRDKFEGQPQAARTKVKLKRSRNFAYQWSHWDNDSCVKVGSGPHTQNPVP